MLTRFIELLVEVWLSLLRVLPMPCRTGLVAVGRPGSDAPVLLTGNYRLTVQRVKRALRGADAWLLVANSRGVNVWCAATGGMLTDHDVVSVLKTSGIASRVDHRDVILPQLAATGVEARVIQGKTGWRVHWGPVEARDIAAYLQRGRHKTPAMREVRFPWRRRLEMAAAWAFPMSLLALLLAPVWPRIPLGLIAMTWAMALGLFASFPLVEPLLRRERRTVGWMFWDSGAHGALLMLWGLCLVALLVAVASGAGAWDFFARWAIASLLVLLILGFDFAGSTPVLKSALHPDRQMRISLDADRCEGVGACADVCPTAVFVVDVHRHVATMPGFKSCVQCGACIVQCPCDALFFAGENASRVNPDAVRKFKLNLLGKRDVKVGGDRRAARDRRAEG